MKNIIKKLAAVVASAVIVLVFFCAESFMIKKVFPKTVSTAETECIRYKNNGWKEDFQVYFKTHNMNQKIRNLKTDMDKISIQYVNQYMKNSKYWYKCTNLCREYSDEKLWSKYDKKLFNEFEKTEIPDLYKELEYNPFILKSIYGMKDLPSTVLAGINGKDIIDVGAGPGDTVYTFHKNFPQSNIYAYEPVIQEKNRIDLMIKKLSGKDNPALIHTIQKGIGDSEYIENWMQWNGNVTNNINVVTLDNEYPKIGNNNLGLIKMDIEGMESSAVMGAQNIIKQYKPVLTISIYHSPFDFFEMKNKIKALNPDYKFMIRRAENCVPDADIVLIAY